MFRFERTHPRNLPHLRCWLLSQEYQREEEKYW
jgi:hypothetical protein